MITVGLDLHKRYITACALDESGTVLAEHRRLELSLDALGRWLGGLAQPVQVVMEATLYWHWLERQLSARGFAVLVAHPYQVKLPRLLSDLLDGQNQPSSSAM
jgi:transposase